VEFRIGQQKEASSARAQPAYPRESQAPR
jgi:hypothetical protein